MFRAFDARRGVQLVPIELNISMALDAHPNFNSDDFH